MDLKTRLLAEGEEPAWDAFVEAHPDGTFFHCAGWRRVVARSFGHATYYVLTERGGVITGVLPLGRIKTLLFGDLLVSAPFCVYGGPLAADAESMAALLAEAEAVMARLGTKVMEFRTRTPPASQDGAEDQVPGWITRSDLYVTFRKAISGDDEANLKAIPRKQRAMVRKGIANGLTSVVEYDATRLYPIYAESVRNLGTPVFARRYFDVMLEEFAGRIDIVTILDGERAISSVMNFYFREEVVPYYGGGTAFARERAANDFLYWEVMRRAAARGCRLFDFGRSKLGTGAMAFKKNWGFTPEPLQYRYKLAPGAEVPNLNPLNPKFRLFIAMWKRLPLPIAGILGPPIVRGLG
jgi:FemAB-related protein (PEP-CTERM system-associated)